MAAIFVSRSMRLFDKQEIVMLLICKLLVLGLLL